MEPLFIISGYVRSLYVYWRQESNTITTIQKKDVVHVFELANLQVSIIPAAKAGSQIHLTDGIHSTIHSTLTLQKAAEDFKQWVETHQQKKKMEGKQEQNIGEKKEEEKKEEKKENEEVQIVTFRDEKIREEVQQAILQLQKENEEAQKVIFRFEKEREELQQTISQLQRENEEAKQAIQESQRREEALKAFQQTLRELKQLFKHEQLQAPKCFISYAWEQKDTPKELTTLNVLQQWLGRFSENLEKLGATVFFDLDHMDGHLRKEMRSNISQSNCFFIICTPRWKQRIEEGLTPSLKNCLEKDLMAELEVGLKSLESNQPDANFNPTNNASFEFIHIWNKVRMQPDLNKLILLHFSGTFEGATLPALKEYLIRDVSTNTDEEYFSVFLNLSNPVGIIPSIFGLKNKEYCLRTYGAHLNNFHSQMKIIKSSYA